MWRSGGAGETAGGFTKTRISYDSPSQWSRRDGREDAEVGRQEEAGGMYEIPDEKVNKFDALLRRIEAERDKISAAEESRPPTSPSSPRRGTTATPSRLTERGGNHPPAPESMLSPSRGATVTPRRAQRGGNAPPSSSPSGNYDFANRARELRMSLDGGAPPARSGTSRLFERGSKENHFVQLARGMAPPGGASPSPMKSRPSHDGMPPSRAFTPKRPASPSVRSDFSHRHRDTPPHRSASNTPVRSYSPMRPPSPSPVQADFRLQVEKFHGSLVSAHDIITTLEKDVRDLNNRVDEKDEFISKLEERNRSLDEALARCRDEVRYVADERSSLVMQRQTESRRHTEELERLRSECDGYRERAGDADKLSAQCDKTVNEIKEEADKLEGNIRDKDVMIGSLRNEVQRLNEELADGSFVRSQASQAAEAAKKLEAELASATKIIVDLEVRTKEKTDECDRKLKEKENEIMTLKSELAGGNSVNQKSASKASRLESQLDHANLRNEELSEKASKASRLETQLDDANLQNEELSEIVKELEQDLSEKVEELEQSLLRFERTAKKKDEEIERVESMELEWESREKDLTRQLEKERRDLERQRKRMEKYDADGASEQATVAALEKAIESLEAAHDERHDEITRLQQENRSLASALAEAEEYMKMYRHDMKDSSNLKSTVGELQYMNSDLVDQVRKRDKRVNSLDDRIRKLHEHIGSLEMQVESSNASSKQRVLELENEVTSKQGDIERLQREIDPKHQTTVQEESANDKLVEMATLLDENVTELEQLRTFKGKMLWTIAGLENEVELLKKEIKSSGALGAKLDQECQQEKSRKDAKRAWSRTEELEEEVTILQEKLSEAERQREGGSRIEELESELASVKAKLAERNEQLADSRKGIAEAQKMIFRLMGTVQELRKKAREESTQFVALG